MIQREWLYDIAGDKNSEQDYHDFNVLINTENSNRIITCYLHNDFHIFMDNSLKEVQEILLADTLDRIKEIYIPGLFKWLQENNDELMKEIIEIEKSLNEFVLSEDNYNEYRNLLEGYKSLYVKAIGAFKPKSKKKGGEIEMALIVKAPIRRLVDEGVYPAKVAEVILEEDEQYGGERIVFTFELEDEVNDDDSPVRVFAYCTSTLSPKSKLRKFVEILLGGKLSKEDAEQGVDLEPLVELPCQVGMVHQTSKDGNIYAKVDTLYPLIKKSKKKGNK